MLVEVGMAWSGPRTMAPLSAETVQLWSLVRFLRSFSVLVSYNLPSLLQVRPSAFQRAHRRHGLTYSQTPTRPVPAASRTRTSTASQRRRPRVPDHGSTASSRAAPPAPRAWMTGAADAAASRTPGTASGRSSAASHAVVEIPAAAQPARAGRGRAHAHALTARPASSQAGSTAGTGASCQSGRGCWR